MKTAIYFNTFAKMVNYDLKSLTSNNTIKNIAVVSEDEYVQFNNYYGKYFSEIIPCESETDDPFNKINFSFAKDVIHKQMAQSTDVKIICLSEDNILLSAKLRDEFEISGMKLEYALPFRDKVIMKDALRSKNVRIPRYYKFDCARLSDTASYFLHLQNELGLPFILKPTLLLGSLGVTLIDSLITFLEFCQNKPIHTEYEAEEFISGTLFHCDSIRKDNKTIFSVCCEYTNPNFDFQAGKSVISMILNSDAPLTKRIFSFNENVLTALNFKEGITHHEIFLTKNNELVFLEIAARSPGAIVTPMYRRAFGIGFEDIDYKMQMDIPFDLNPRYDDVYLSGIFPVIPGKVEKLVSPPIKSQHEMNWLIKPGENINSSKSLRDKASTIIAWNKNPYELRDDFNFLRSFQSVIVT